MTLIAFLLSACVLVLCVGILATPRMPRRWMIHSVSGPRMRQIVEGRTPEQAFARAGLDPNDVRLRCDPLD